jgi:hypothetical protein
MQAEPEEELEDMPPLEDIIPGFGGGTVPVGLHDGFDEPEAREEEVDQALLSKVNAMQVDVASKESPVATNGRAGPFIQFLKEDDQAEREPEPPILAVNQNVYEQIKSASQSGSVGPNSNDMIPPLRGLSNLQVSFGLVQDVNMYQADTILGKRAAEEEEVQGGRLDLTLGLNYGGDATMGRVARSDQN